MIRAQRRIHALIWPVLALVLCAIVGAALTTRHHAASVVVSAPHAGPR
jgi:hypothetical protein